MQLIKLTGTPLLDKIIASFSTASGRVLTMASKLSATPFTIAAYQGAVRELDLAGAFIPESDLRNTGLTLENLATKSEAHPIAYKEDPSPWARVQQGLSDAGAMAPAEIHPATTLLQIGVGITWVGRLNPHFTSEGVRFFESDMSGAVTADDVFQVVRSLILKKVSP